MLTDDELLDFDRERLADPADERELLGEHGDVYRAQLVAARWLETWAERMLKRGPSFSGTEDYGKGVDYGLREVIAHLRQGDFVPGGAPYEAEINGNNEL
jgi:hypothetical protein